MAVAALSEPSIMSLSIPPNPNAVDARQAVTKNQPSRATNRPSDRPASDDPADVVELRRAPSTLAGVDAADAIERAKLAIDRRAASANRLTSPDTAADSAAFAASWIRQQPATAALAQGNVTREQVSSLLA